MVFGLSGNNSFDTVPVLGEGVVLADGTKVADSGGLGAYVYSANTRTFEFKEFYIP
jgi:hypothetical protein